MSNVNWPLIDEAISFTSGPNDPAPVPLWASIIGRTEGAWTSARGRQYELDQVQAGQASSTLQNRDAAFDPGNTASPFYPNVTPYRAYRRRAQLPATPNLLTADQATAFYASQGSASSTALPTWVSGSGAAGITGLNVASHVAPSNAYTANVASSVTVPADVVQFSGWSVQPSSAFTGQMVATGTAGIHMAATIHWYSSTGTLISTTTGTPVTFTGATVTLTVTGTAPAKACGAVLALTVTTAPAGSTVVACMQIQIEQAASASGWVQPGTWFGLFNGFVTRWPQAWTDGGTYGTSGLSAVDAFGYLSQRKILSPSYMEALALAPTFLYPLDEASGSTVFYDLAGANQPITQILAPGATTGIPITPGTTLTTTSTAGYQPLGIGGPVVGFSATTALPSNLINLGARGVQGPPTGTGWTRIFAFTAAANASSVWLWQASAPGTPTGAAMTQGYLIEVASTGQVAGGILIGGTAVYSEVFTNSVFDGGWHFVAMSMSSDGKACTMYLDGQTPLTGTSATDMRTNVAGGLDLVGPFWFGFAISSATSMVAEVPSAITAAQWTQLYSTFRYGGSGLGTASSTTRFQDILRWGRWAGAQQEDSYTLGETVQYGPAVELLAAANQSGTDVVSALQTVIDTENGEQYVDANGTVTFKARRARYAQQTPAVVFGENVTGGEIPYTNAGFGLDPTRLANDMQLTQTVTSNATRQIDQPSINTYGDVQLQRTLNTLDTNEIKIAAGALLADYKTPQQRLETLVISPSTFTINGVPSTVAWQACLSLELGTPVTVNRRPPGVPMISFDGFVEQINWSIDDQLQATCTLQISPNTVQAQQAWQWGVSVWSPDTGTLTLNASITAAATTLALKTAAGHPTCSVTAGSYPVTVLIDLEQITLTAVPGGSTSPQSYTGVVRGVNGTIPAAHTTGAVVTPVKYGLWTY